MNRYFCNTSEIWNRETYTWDPSTDYLGQMFYTVDNQPFYFLGEVEVAAKRDDGEAGGGEYSLFFDGRTISVWLGKNLVYYTSATSGKGEHMNNPASQNLSNLGPIPEGNYYFYNTQWKSQNTLRQVYNIIAGNGDWGDYNVPLIPIDYQGSRNSFYLHGGFFEGSAGCIDVGGYISNIYNYVYNQDITYLRVKY